jgi:hypothetical protein
MELRKSAAWRFLKRRRLFDAENDLAIYLKQQRRAESLIDFARRRLGRNPLQKSSNRRQFPPLAIALY